MSLLFTAPLIVFLPLLPEESRRFATGQASTDVTDEAGTAGHEPRSGTESLIPPLLKEVAVGRRI